MQLFYVLKEKRQLGFGSVSGTWSDMHGHCGHVLPLFKQMIAK